MSGGDAWIHHMWSGDFLYVREALAKKKTDYDFEAPKEGTPINSDAYAIPTNAKHPGTAMLFIDCLLRPENAVKNINYLYYPFPVKDAVAELQRPRQGRAGLQRRGRRTWRTPTSSGCCPPTRSSARAAVWTEVKASLR